MTRAQIPRRVLTAWCAAVLVTAGAARTARCGVEPLTVLGHPIEYVIVTQDSLAPGFTPLAEWKTRTGVPAAVMTLSAIRAAYPSGADDAERIRLFLRDAHQLAGARWALLGGDSTQVPTRLAFTTFFGGVTLPTDLYFSCLDGNWDANGNGIYGEGAGGPGGPDDADLIPELYVGRAPVASKTEVGRFVARTLHYERTPDAAPNAPLVAAAEVLFPEDWSGGPTTLDGAQLIEELLPEFDLAPGLSVTRLYENFADPGWRPGAIQESRDAVLSALAAGADFALLVGHGTDSTLSVGTGILSSADAGAIGSGAHPMNVYSIGASAGSFAGGALGRALMTCGGPGAVSLVGSASFDFPTATRPVEREFWRLVLEAGVRAVGEAHARSKLPFVPFSSFDGVNRWTQMSLTLLGDPELRLRLGPPHTLEVRAPSSLASGDTAFDVAASVDGAAVSGARVTAYRAGHELEMSSTGEDGVARVAYEAAARDTFDLTVVADDCVPFETRIAVLDQPTPTLASLVRATATSEAVDLLWSLPGRAGESAVLERRRAGEAPVRIAAIAVDGRGMVGWIDRDVRPGERLAYDLVVGAGSDATRTPEAWVDIPAASAIARLEAFPNPGPRTLGVRVTLPDAGPARLAWLDVGGRLIASRDLSRLGAGTHQVRFEGGAPPPGLYLLRLDAAGVHLTRRVVVLK